MRRLGTGIGWRPEIADAVERMPGIDWVEVVAENVCPGHLPQSLLRLRERGVTVIPHGVSLGLGGADRPDEDRLSSLAERAEALGSPLVTEHIAFVRAGGPLTASPRLEAGHLLPVPRTRDALDVLCENVRIAQDVLPVPLALENIAALFSWPGEELTEGQFLSELVERTGVRLLIDVANLHTNHVNRGEDPAEALAALPVEAIAYVHVAGGFERDGVWHDSHAHPVPRPVLDILTDLASRTTPPGVLLERDENFPDPTELEQELTMIRTAIHTGRERAAGGPRGAGAGAEGSRGAAGAAAEPVDGGGAGLTGGETAEPANAGGARPTSRAAAEPVDGGGTAPTDGEGAELASGRDARPTSRAVTDPVNGTTAWTAGEEADEPAGGRGAGAASGASAGPAGAGGVRTGTGPAGGVGAPAGDAGAGPADGAGAGPAGGDAGVLAPSGVRGRERVGVAQAAVLSSLVAGTPVPEGFDRVRMGVQARALAAKRADVVAKVAPELPVILGDGYRAAFLDYARERPMSGGYRQDALTFAAHLLKAGPSTDTGTGTDTGTHRALRAWWLDRAGPAPRSGGRVARATRRVLLRHRG
ncbi:DUF692 domain-containing protein [Streptomyces alanosinicus]|uniref:SCO6045-like C-terminal domain-containing protein n=1 Tax=Streptomyces alanosinicus TaxID=68171 RepID=A0A919D2P8_9ACTN|nr:DUF692 domain-containing protein [Streptomyces alanosinicus]GHE01475.1 hypothetical protein GCM10010339_20830 [Streptomyces alanosinicus]